MASSNPDTLAVRQDALLLRAIRVLLWLSDIPVCVACGGNFLEHRPDCELRAILDEWDKMQGKEKP